MLWKESSVPPKQSIGTGDIGTQNFQRFGKASLTVFAILFALGKLLSINEIFVLGFAYHEFFYFYGLLAMFLSSAFLIFPAAKGDHDKLPWYDIIVTDCL